MLSGIGPAEHLVEKDIKPVLNLEGVGSNLQDHIAMGGATFLFDSPEDSKPLGYGSVLPRLMTLNTLRQFRNGTGPLYGLPFAEAMAFVSTRYVLNVYVDFSSLMVRVLVKI